MNDRYLYRAKRKNWRELPKEMWWVEGYYAYFKGNDNHCIYYETDELTLVCDIDISTLCACTGKNDVDGKLIFEHDIVTFLDAQSTENGWSERSCLGEVCWDDETISFQVTNRLSAESWEVLDDECSVVGNAIDNQELLEVGE